MMLPRMPAWTWVWVRMLLTSFSLHESSWAAAELPAVRERDALAEIWVTGTA